MSDTLFDTGIRPLVDAHLTKLSEEVRDYGDYWSASSAGMCMRLQIMKRLKVPPVPEIADDRVRTQRVFSVGHIFHNWIQELTRNAGLSIAQEVELQDEDLMVRGHFDDLVLIKLSESGEPVVGTEETRGEHLILYDYKTVNSQAFKYKKDKMSYHHKMQLGTYMYMIRKIVETGSHKNLDTSLSIGQNYSGRKAIFPAGLAELSEGRILNISKDDLRMAETRLLWSESLEEEVKEYWTKLNAYWKVNQDTGALPSCTCLDHDGGWMGRRSSKGKIYCDYFWEDECCSLEWYELNKGKLKERT